MPNFQLMSTRKTEKRTPTPESVMLVNSKVDLFNSFKANFQGKRSKSRYLTPLENSTSKIHSINLTSLNVKNYGLGDSRAQLLSSTLKSMDRLQKLNIKGNGMNEIGSSSILDSLNRENIKTLDVSSNRIGLMGIEKLSEILKNDFSALEDLNIENIKITLKGLALLCSSLKYNRSLRSLNIANNKIGLGSGTILSEMIDCNNHIKILDLQWNFLRGLDALTFCVGLKSNYSIKILDLSWNSMGHDMVHNSIPVIFSNLFLNESIEHLDLSNNNFSLEDCKAIAEKVKVNHKIKGLHFEGNYGNVDALGFIEPLVYALVVKSGKSRHRITSKQLAKTSENCWICNNWTDVVIGWDPTRIVWNRRLKHFALDKLSSQVEPIYIHLEVDGYKPFLLTITEFKSYECKRALPPGKIKFFFTYRGIAQISNQYQVEVVDPPIEQSMHFYGTFHKTVLAVVVNYLYNDTTELTCIPRPVMQEYVPPPGDEPEPNIPPWLFETSIFSGYIQDTADLLNKCFEADWSNSKIPKFLKNEISRFSCKEILRQEYSKIFYTYRFLCSLTMNFSLYSVNLNTLTDFYMRKGVIDKVFKISDLDLNIRACTSASSSIQFNNNFSVVRHEFLELQVRIALDKFLRSGIYSNEPQSLSHYFQLNIYLSINPNEWRIRRYYNEECDAVLSGNKELLLTLYEGTKGKFTKTIDKKGLLEEDFIGLMQENGFFNDKFTLRYGFSCFHFALMTRVDELTNNSYMLAGFLEFLEAFARVCDLYDSNDIEKDSLCGFCNENIPLDKKIESALTNFSYLKRMRTRR